MTLKIPITFTEELQVTPCSPPPPPTHTITAYLPYPPSETRMCQSYQEMCTCTTSYHCNNWYHYPSPHNNMYDNLHTLNKHNTHWYTSLLRRPFCVGIVHALERILNPSTASNWVPSLSEPAAVCQHSSDLPFSHHPQSTPACVCVCVCVSECVCVRERERERERVCVCVCVCV